ncbi:MAG: hypothetical protein A2W28_01295 [Gammaproteobacteria bacterium RBG_16_51_14]|nr:MAG: hypothetical protein A2W28_01295 [Gammaproteobacteria bacterium RBG_16_51_14]
MVNKQPIQPIPLLLTAVLVAITLSLLWSYFWAGQQRQFGSMTGFYETRIKKLEQQAQEYVQTQQELVSTLTKAQEDRVTSETNLAEVTAELGRANDRLTTIEQEDWQSRYTAATTEIGELTTRLEELELRREVEIHDLEEQTNILADHRRFLEIELISLAFDQDELRESCRGIRSLVTGMENELILLDFETDAIREFHTMKQQQSKQACENRLAKLRSELDQANQETIQTVQQTAAVADEPPVTPIKQDSTYRSVRLESLINAMQNQDSGNRKEILIRIIPTIPDGITGDELALLLSGMSSTDALHVIQAADQQIRRPLDAKALERITSHLDAGAAELAVEILSAQAGDGTEGRTQ